MSQIVIPPIPGASATGPPLPGSGPDAGSSISYSRDDHGHGFPVGVTGTTSPPGRYAPGVAQLQSGEILLFGGYGISGSFAETWLFSQGEWIQQNPTTSPPGRFVANMVPLDTGEALLFGGENGGGILNDTWIWSGGDWTQQSPATSPSGRYGASAAQLSSGQALLFGGYSGSAELNDTWIWSGGDWTQQSPATSPGVRNSAGLTQLSSGQVLLFGGYSGSAELSDTWLWSGGDWTQQSPTANPTARSNMGMEQLASGQILLFGGNNGVSYVGDTWLWTGGQWTQVQFAVTSVGVAYEQEIIATTATTLLTYTPTASGIFDVGVYFRVAVAATDVAIQVTATDAGGAQTWTLLATTLEPVGSYTITPIKVACIKGSAITITITVGTANQVYASASIQSGG